MSEFEYTPIDFSKIDTVDIIDKTDEDFIKWKDFIYNKERKTKAQLRREKERKDFPSEWEELKQKYLNRICGECKKLYGTWCYGIQERITKNFHRAKQCDFYRMKIEFFDRNNNRRSWCKHLNLHDTNIKYYLYELGLIEKPKNPIRKAKQKEIDFRKKLKEFDGIDIVDKFFKIYLINGKTTYKFPDVVFKKNNKYSIIEYKTDSYCGKFTQILDYAKLFNLATIEELGDLYWVIYYGDDFWLERLKKEALKEYNGEIQVYSEEEFIESFTIELTGLSAWM